MLYFLEKTTTTILDSKQLLQNRKMHFTSILLKVGACGTRFSKHYSLCLHTSIRSTEAFAKHNLRRQNFINFDFTLWKTVKEMQLLSFPTLPFGMATWKLKSWPCPFPQSTDWCERLLVSNLSHITSTDGKHLWHLGFIILAKHVAIKHLRLWNVKYKWYKIQKVLWACA